MVAERLTAVLTPAQHRVQVLIPEKCELAELFQATLDQAPDEIKIDHRIRVAHFAVFVQVQDTDIREFYAIQQFIEIAGEPFQVGPPLPKPVNPSLVKIETDKTTASQHPRTLQQ